MFSVSRVIRLRQFVALNCNVGSANTLLYADDLKLFCTKAHSGDIVETLSSITDCCHSWQLNVSQGKCMAISFFDNINCNYNVSGCPIVSMAECKDFSIQLSYNWNFEQHILKIVRLALQRTKLVFHCFHYKSANFFLLKFIKLTLDLYCSMAVSFGVHTT